MSITTYAELLTAVQSWLDRTDVAARAPDFVALGEAALNRTLRLRSMQASEALTLVQGERTVALPARFAEAVSLRVTVNTTEQHPTMLSLPQLDAQLRSTPGAPQAAAFGAQIEFDRPADAAYPVTLRYVRTLDLAADGTNTVLTAAPDAYLYSALVAAAPYLQEDARLGTWQTLLGQAVAELVLQDQRTQSKAVLTADAALLGRGHFDISGG